MAYANDMLDEDLGIETETEPKVYASLQTEGDESVHYCTLDETQDNDTVVGTSVQQSSPMDVYQRQTEYAANNHRAIETLNIVDEGNTQTQKEKYCKSNIKYVMLMTCIVVVAVAVSSSITAAILKQNPRPPAVKRLQYERANLERAYGATVGGMSVYKASRVYNVPESTLRDRTRGLVAVDAKNGTGTLLSKCEEKELVTHIKYMADIGYGYNKSDVQYMARDFAVSLGKNVRSQKSMSNSWFYDFIKRWPELKLATPQKLGMARAKAASPITLQNYFKELHSILQTHDLFDHPENIYNIDETGVSTEHTPTKIVCGKNSVAQSLTSPRSSNVTIIACGNALGNHVPPYYVFPGKRWTAELLEGAATGATGLMTKNGWSNSEVFTNYLKNHFVKYASLDTSEGGRKTLILYDGHKSHVLLTLTEWATAHNAILFVLPPHSSHLTQPLDVGVFGPFKRMLHSECQSYMRQNPGISVTRYDVAKLTARPYTRALSTENLTAAFRKAEVYPFNDQVISAEQVAPSIIYQDQIISDSQHRTQPESEQEQEALSQISTTVDEQYQVPTPEEREILSPIQTTDAPVDPTPDTAEPINLNFFEKRTIKTVVQKPKRKFVPPYLSGSLMNKTNQNIMEASAAKKEKKETKQPKLTSKNQKSKNIVKKNKENVMPMPGTSGINERGDAPGIDLTSEPSDDSDDNEDHLSVDASELCCICHDWQPKAFRGCKTLNFVSRDQCDFCGHWTHLKYCSEIRVLIGFHR